MPPRPDVSEQRTVQIIQAAIPIFAEKGFDRTTMEDIATVAGINKATIYLYFDNKDTLIRAIAEQVFAQELADLQTARHAPGTATERLAAFYEVLIAEEADVLDLMPIVYDFYALGLRRDDVRAVLAAFMEQSAALLQAIIEEGVAAGEFAPMDARRTARTFTALLDGIMLQWAYMKELDVDAQLRFSVQLLFRGLANHR
jgi:AcrR family transcriptional regulator